MESDDITILRWALGGIAAAGTVVTGFLNMKTNKLQSDLDDQKEAMHAGFTAATKAQTEGFDAATKAAEAIGKNLTDKIEKTQDSVQKIAVEQGKQGENIKNMDQNVKEIANIIKSKAP